MRALKRIDGGAISDLSWVNPTPWECPAFPSVNDSTLAMGSRWVAPSVRREVQERTLYWSIGPYRILSLIGAGSYGEVYRGRHEMDTTGNGEVAIKCLRGEDAESDHQWQHLCTRFRREREILGQIDHPNVVRMIDCGDEPMPYLVMEYLPGGTLRKRMRPGEPFDPGLALKIARGMLRGLAALHEKRVIHRDLKPANVLFRDGDEPVIADLGIARSLDLNTITLRSTVLGTLAYMAPEQLRGEPVDGRADVYAMGGILFELLTGRRPFEGGAPRELMRRICDETPPSLAATRPGLPRSVANCVARCLEKDPAKRYATAHGMLAALEA